MSSPDPTIPNFPKPLSSDYLRTDFHTHTIFSKDSLTTPEKLIAICKRKKIDRVVVTDHNTIEGALRCKELDPQRVIIGEEIMTTGGEILAVYVSEEIPPNLTPLETIERLREQNAFISVSHPCDALRKGSWSINALLEIIPYVDAIETFNARCMFPWYNWRAEKIAKEHNIPGTQGSDGHAAFEIGRGSLLLPSFENSETLKESLQKAVSPPLMLSSPFVHFTSRYAVWRKRTSSL